MEQRPMKYYALRYVEKGFAVFPLRQGGKEPLTKNGCKDASRDAGQAERWWDRWPEANIGIAAGSPSGGLVVIDVDVDEDRGVYGGESLRLWEEEFSPLPPTLTALTGRGGAHYYFRTDREVRNRTGALEGVDVRGEGGYVVAPPSLHPNGRRYCWEASSTGEPARLTEDLLALVLPSSSGGAHFQMPEQVAEGRRNDTIFRLASSLQAKGLSDTAVYQAALAENEARCSPPLPQKEVEGIVTSALRYEKGDSLETQAEAAAAVENAVRSSDAVTLLREETFAGIYRLTDLVERTEAINRLRDQARKLRVLKEFNDLLSAWRRREIQKKKGDGSNLIQFTDAPLAGLRCGSWVCDDLGVRRFRENNSPEGGGWEYACPHPIMPVERLRNADTGLEKIRLAFAKDGKWRSVVLDRSATNGGMATIKLADHGIQVISKTTSLLGEYLQEVETLNMDRIPLRRSIRRFGWVDGDFSPYAKDLKYDGNSEEGDESGFYSSVHTAGSYEDWLCAMESVRSAAIPARLALAASFASPLIGIVGKLPFMLHLWGGSETGKSVSQLAAASVWGRPEVGAYVRSLNNTKNCAEALASFCNALPLILDELQTINDERGSHGGFDQLVYLLCSGQGRGRLDVRGELRPVGRWKLCTITSGERPLTSNASGGGVLNRVLELECGQSLFIDAAGVAEQVCRNYGWAGQKWIELLSEPEVREEVLAAYQPAYAALLSQGKAEKQSFAAALCIAADVLADRRLFHDGRALTVEELGPYVLARGDIDMGERAYQWILSWIAANPVHFDGASSFSEVWGKQVLSGETVTEYRIIAQVLRANLENAGFSYKACISALARQGRIVPQNGKNTQNTRFSNGVQARCVVLKVSGDADGNLSDEMFDEI